MKEINIARTVVSKRHEKGITQDELASYIGVSKASVSKWETGQSYPDISLLPQLAAYFNISIDELMNYSPQMTNEDIKDTYHRLARDFGEKPFDEVLDEFHQIIKKYYSCFPLLLQMAILLLNHVNLAKENARQAELIEEVSELCVRVKSESEDTNQSAQANSIHAMCCLMQNKPAEVIDLLESWEYLSKNDDSSMLSNAYLAMGNVNKAKEILQISTYTGLLSMMQSSSILLLLSKDNEEKSQLIIQRQSALIDIFDLQQLHVNTVLIFYLSAAQNCITRGKTDEAVEFLEKYADICCSLEYPLTLHGDRFFDSIEDWFETFELGNSTPTEEKTIRSNMLESVTRDPALASLSENDRYQAVISRLEANTKG